MSELRVEKHGHIAVVTLDNPPVNAMSPEWDIQGTFDAITADEDVRVVILTGQGDRVFCAGRRHQGRRARRPRAAARAHRLPQRARELLRDHGVRRARDRRDQRPRPRRRARPRGLVRLPDRVGARRLRPARDRRRPARRRAPRDAPLPPADRAHDALHCPAPRRPGGLPPGRRRPRRRPGAAHGRGHGRGRADRREDADRHPARQREPQPHRGHGPPQRLPLRADPDRAPPEDRGRHGGQGGLRREAAAVFHGR